MEKAAEKPLNTNLAIEIPDNEESLGTCLLLRFAPEAHIPSREDLMTTFCRFGPLKVFETQLLKDSGSAQVVFVKSEDATEAFHSLEHNKIVFGSTLVDYKLHHLSAACPPIEQLVIPSQPTGSMERQSETPHSLQFIKQNLQMMTSVLENSGNSLSPETREKLDVEIKNLMRKVNSRLGHISP